MYMAFFFKAWSHPPIANKCKFFFRSVVTLRLVDQYFNKVELGIFPKWVGDNSQKELRPIHD